MDGDGDNIIMNISFTTIKITLNKFSHKPELSTVIIIINNNK